MIAFGSSTHIINCNITAYSFILPYLHILKPQFHSLIHLNISSFIRLSFLLFRRRIINQSLNLPIHSPFVTLISFTLSFVHCFQSCFCLFAEKKTYKMGLGVCVCVSLSRSLSLSLSRSLSVCVCVCVCVCVKFDPLLTISKPVIRLIRNIDYIQYRTGTLQRH